MAEPTPAELAVLGAALAPLEAQVGIDGATREAAVLIPFFQDPAAHETGLSLVLVEKSSHLRTHAGQVAFPGGGVDASDADVSAAALREAHEEVGIVASDVRLLGLMQPVQAVTGHRVSPVVAWWREPAPLSPVDTVEVAAVHLVTVDDLRDSGNRQTWRHPLGFTGPAFVIDDLFIWGLTARLLDDLIHLGGWEQPWDQGRVVPIPARFDGTSN